MSELTDVLGAIDSLSARGQKLALATIVAAKGSTYRRPGARLLVAQEGDVIGNLSGGCLEGDVAEVARIVLEEGVPRIASWDLTADDDEVWGLGLGCNGAIDVFVEPAAKAAEVARALRTAMDQERPIAMITVLEGDVPGVEPGDRILVTPDGSVRGSLGDELLEARAREDALELLGAERTEIRELGGITGVARAFIEVLEPPTRLIVCGAGHDAVPVVRAAAALGWSPIVVDDRAELLTEERFPEAAGFVGLERPDEVGTNVTLDERTYAVVMTHNFRRDQAYLRTLLGSKVRFIAMLGPAARTRRIILELRRGGMPITEADLERIHAPAGLDIGAEGPEEIAAAIVTEIVAAKRGREGGFLRDRQGPIHDRNVHARSSP